MEFKVGDKVALRATPNVLHGVIDKVSEYGSSSVYSRFCSVGEDDARYIDGTQGNYPESDYVPYVEQAGPKKFWLPVKLQANGQYDLTLEQALAVAQEQAEKTGAAYIVVEAVARVERPVPPVTVTKFV